MRSGPGRGLSVSEEEAAASLVPDMKEQLGWGLAAVSRAAGSFLLLAFKAQAVAPPEEHVTCKTLGILQTGCMK